MQKPAILFVVVKQDTYSKVLSVTEGFMMKLYIRRCIFIVKLPSVLFIFANFFLNFIR